MAADLLVVGLGNPGAEYTRSRHNVGAEAVELLAQRSGTKLKPGKDRSLVADARLGGKRVVLAFPTTYMNDSGTAVGMLIRRHHIDDLADLIVVHDELDLPPGRLKVKLGGGLAGHNGLRSITAHLKSEEFVRVRIGVGKPPTKEAGAGHVLRKVPKAERELLDVMVQTAADAVEAIAEEGVEVAMARFNAAP